jgi:hypothetical protein
MKIIPQFCMFAKIAVAVFAFLFSSVMIHAQNFSGYDLIVPAGAPGTLTVLDGTGKTLPATRSYVIGIDGGTRGSIQFRNWTGTANYPIVVTNRPGTGRVTITDDSGTGTPTLDGIDVIDCRYLQLRGDNDPAIRYGIEIARAGGLSSSRLGLNITGKSSYVEAMFLEIHHSGFAGIMAKQDPLCGTGNEWTWFPTLAYHDIKLHDNYVHDTGGECFYIGFTAWDSPTKCGQWGHEIYGLKIYNNLVERGGWDGIQVGSSPGAEIYNNMIVDSGVDLIRQDYGNTGRGVQIGAGTSGLFYNNTIINSRGESVALFGVGNNYLFNNLLVGGIFGMFSDARPDGVPAGQPAERQTQADAPYYFFNNTVINPSELGLWTMNEVSANYFKNNILIVPGDATHDFIRYGGTSPTPGGEAGNVMQRDFTGMNFVNPTPGAYDFRITGASNAKDAGVSLAEVPVDFQGFVRPQGASSDAGFSESGVLSTYLVSSPPTVGANNGSITASTIGGTAPYTYAWSHGPTTAALTGLSPGLYQVTVSDATGASTTQATYLFAGAEMGAPVAVTLPGHVAPPAFTPAPGTYGSARSVTLTSATAGASFRYTLDGTTPTPTTGTLYSGAIAVNSTATLKAIAYKAGMADSSLSVGNYLIGLAPAAPAGMTIATSDRRAYLTWNAVAGVNRYEVRRATINGGPWPCGRGRRRSSFEPSELQLVAACGLQMCDAVGSSSQNALIAAVVGKRVATTESMEVVGSLNGQIRFAKRDNFFGFHMDHARDVLQFSGDFESGLLRNCQPVFLEKRRIHDCVCNAGFVFETHKYHAFCRAGTLAANNRTGNDHLFAVGPVFQFRRGANIRQAAAKGDHRMAASGKSHCTKIGLETFRETHGRERRIIVFRARKLLKQTFFISPHGFHLPQGGATVESKPVECADRGQSPSFRGVERGSAKKVID